jgi:hypothetical protein
MDMMRERAKQRRNKAFIEVQMAGPSTIDDNNVLWLVHFITSYEGTEDEEE